MKPTTQMGGAPLPSWQHIYCRKTAEPNHMQFFFISREMNLVHWYFFVGPNFDPFSGFLEKTTPLPEEGLNILANNSKRLGRELKM